MEPFKIIFIALTVSHVFSGGSNFQAAARPVSSISAVPALSPDASPESDYSDYSTSLPPESHISAIPDASPGPDYSTSLPPVSDVSTVPASSPDASSKSYYSAAYSAFASTVLPPESQISAVPASAPTDAPASSPGPTPEDIDVDFDVVTNVEDLVPKFEHIQNFDFSAMKIDTTARDLCNSTDFTNECIAAILPDLQKRADEGKSSADPEDVIRMEARSLIKKANATLQYAKRLKNDGSTEKPVKEAMGVCVENYDSLLSDLDEAEKAMESGDYGRLESVLSAAIADVSTCSDNFVGVPGVDSPTASLDDFMRKLCSNILAMSQKIQNSR